MRPLQLFRLNDTAKLKPKPCNLGYKAMDHGLSVVPPVVLVVEDEGFIRMLAADILQDEGFTVLEVATADEAWLILESRNDIGVLFTDVNMPGSMDGLDLATRVAVRWPHIRLVLTSGRCGLSNDEIPDHGQFVQKPYCQRELVSAIAHAV